MTMVLSYYEQKLIAIWLLGKKSQKTKFLVNFSYEQKIGKIR